MKAQSTIRVKEWFRDKLATEARKYHILLNGEYDTVGEVQMLNHETLRVEAVLGETEKAFRVVLDGETTFGNPHTYTAWIPKSVIIEA